MSKTTTYPQLQTLTIDRFTFEPSALAHTQADTYQAQLTIASGHGTGRTHRFFTFTPMFNSADRAVAYAVQQAREWMKQKALA